MFLSVNQSQSLENCSLACKEVVAKILMLVNEFGEAFDFVLVGFDLGLEPGVEVLFEGHAHFLGAFLGEVRRFAEVLEEAKLSFDSAVLVDEHLLRL